MKCSVVLLSFLITVVYSHPHSNSSGFPAIFWGGERITKSNFDVSEWWSTPDKVLECHTDLSTCCSNTQGFHRGDWYFPDGTRAKFRHETNGPVYQSRGDKMVSLYRRGDNVELGEYCCKIETKAEHGSEKAPSSGQSVCIDITNGTGWCKNITWFQNGNASVSGYQLNDTVTFTCDDGFELVGPSTGVCQSSGRWGGWEWWSWEGMPNHPHCRVRCEDITWFRNGTAEVSGNQLNDTVTFTCDDGFGLVGPSKGVCLPSGRWGGSEWWSRRGMPIRPHCRRCADKLIVQAFTSGIAFGHSNEHHSLFISLRKGKNATIDFYNREGDDMAAHKGDIWAFDLSETELPCFDFRDVDKIALVANSNDGWHIESVTTMLGISGWRGTRWALLTVDMDANFWIDANAGEDRKWRYLTRVWWHPQRG